MQRIFPKVACRKRSRISVKSRARLWPTYFDCDDVIGDARCISYMPALKREKRKCDLVITAGHLPAKRPW